MFLSYVTIWYPLGFRLNTMYGEKSSMIVQGLPHACGGVSERKRCQNFPLVSSPRMWGCFEAKPTRIQGVYVFPTHVGVFLRCLAFGTSSWSLPHACGGVSLTRGQKISLLPSSPRMWGCFHGQEAPRGSRGVFPTHVGVFPLWASRSRYAACLPHACGGVSSECQIPGAPFESSPRMWGCFLHLQKPEPQSLVFPTHVGVFPP